MHAAKDTFVLFQAQEDRQEDRHKSNNDNARTDAGDAVIHAVVVQANDEWKAICVTGMRVSRFVDALHTAFVDKCPVHFVAGASDFKKKLPANSYPRCTTAAAGTANATCYMAYLSALLLRAASRFPN